MLKKDLEEGLTFDDVLLKPAYSKVLPKHVFTVTELTPGMHLNIPLMSAAMDTVTKAEMATAMAICGGIGIIHKNMSPSDQAEEVKKVKSYADTQPGSSVDRHGRLLVGAAVGVGSDRKDRVSALVGADVDVLVIDTAHGHSEGVLRALKSTKKEFPNTPIIVGNIATAEAARSLICSGADAIKVGIGPGSICTTRIVSGVGVPQMTAISDCFDVAKDRCVPLIADGGIKYSGDVAKALAAGANVVMIGSLFAGTDEAPGELVWENGVRCKKYRGMGSLGAMADGSKDRYGQADTSNDKLVPEGVEGFIPYCGPVDKIVYQLMGGIRSAMGYTGCHNIKTFQNESRFIRITSSGLRESHVHDVIPVDAPNYRKPS